MATHNVSFTLPERALGKADIVFEVKKDKKKLGELRVSNGSAVWFPKSAKQGYRMGWSEMSEFFVTKGQKTERRK